MLNAALRGIYLEMTSNQLPWPPLPRPCIKSERGDLPVLSASIGNSKLSLSTFGGQLLSWTVKGTPVLFENQARALTDGKSPYRGGTPICFPHFNKGTFFPDGAARIPSHGPVRALLWNLEAVEATDTTFFSTLTCSAPSTDGPNPVELNLTVTYRLSDDKLLITTTVFNPGPRSADFQIALHSYFETTSPERAEISGLGQSFVDGLKNGVIDTSSEDPSLVTPPLDRLYPAPKPTLTLKTTEYKLSITHTGFFNAVIWNPGSAHSLKDLAAPNFVCVESAAIVPNPKIAPSAIWTASVLYVVEELYSSPVPSRP